MRVHLAGVIDQRGQHWNDPDGLSIPARVLVDENYPDTLVTPAHPLSAWPSIWQRTTGANVIVDSGAFTAHTTGKPMTVTMLADYISEFMAVHAPTVERVSFVSLDVIGDQQQTWRNFDELQRMGVPVCPVLSARAVGPHDIDRAFEHDYIFIGGIASSGAGGRVVLDPIYKRLLALAEKHGRLPKTHLLGFTRDDLLRYPAYSCDSSSWISVLRYGDSVHSKRLGVKSRSYGKSRADAGATYLKLREDVRAYRALAERHTRLWERRGYTWNDTKS